jgi:hypothetical protein
LCSCTRRNSKDRCLCSCTRRNSRRTAACAAAQGGIPRTAARAAAQGGIQRNSKDRCLCSCTRRNSRRTAACALHKEEFQGPLLVQLHKEVSLRFIVARFKIRLCDAAQCLHPLTMLFTTIFSFLLTTFSFFGHVLLVALSCF